jgi:hypothetical protein
VSIPLLDIPTMQALVRVHLVVELERRNRAYGNNRNAILLRAELADGRSLFCKVPNPRRMTEPTYRPDQWNLTPRVAAAPDTPAGVRFFTRGATFATLPEAISFLLAREVTLPVAGIQGVEAATFRVAPRPALILADQPCPAASPASWAGTLVIASPTAPAQLELTWDAPQVVGRFLAVVEDAQGGQALLDWLQDEAGDNRLAEFLADLPARLAAAQAEAEQTAEEVDAG